MKKILLLIVPVLVLAFSGQVAEARWRHRYHPPVPPPVVQTPAPSGFQWGAFTGDSSILGSLKGVFIGDGDSFTQDFGQYHVPLVVYWESGLTASQIANGAADSYLKNWATEMAAYGQPIIFAPLDEMNGDWNPYYGNPAAYKAAWTRIRQFLIPVSNTKLAWDPNNDPSNLIASYFPGEANVDICALDGFNFGGETWQQTFIGDNAIPTIKALCPDKPLWILSTGSADNQSRFIADTVAGAQQWGISGVIYFDYQQFAASASTIQGL